MNTLKQNALKLAKISLILYWILTFIDYITMDRGYTTDLTCFLTKSLGMILFTIYIFRNPKKIKGKKLILFSYIMLLVVQVYFICTDFFYVSNINESIRYVTFYIDTVQVSAEEYIFLINFSILCIIMYAIHLLIGIISILKENKLLKVLRIEFLIYISIYIIYIIYDYYNYGNNIATLYSTYAHFLWLCVSALFWFFIVESIKEENVVIHTDTQNSLENDLVILKQLYENGTITETEYNLKRAEVLKNF